MSAWFNQSNCLIAMRFPDLFECEGNGSGESSESLPCLGSAQGCLQRAGSWEARSPAGAVGQVLSRNPGSICSVTCGIWGSPQLGTWPGFLGCTPDKGWDFQECPMTRRRNPRSHLPSQQPLSFPARFRGSTQKLRPSLKLSAPNPVAT